MPEVAGLILDDVRQDEVQPLTCLDGLRYSLPGGRIVDGLAAGSRMRITGVSPEAGTPVSRTDVVTVTLELVESPIALTRNPCEWMSPTEVATALEVPNLKATPEGDEQGSTTITCHYSSPGDAFDIPGRGRSISSTLQLAANRVVDAEAEFAYRTATNSVPIEGVGVRGGCAEVTKPMSDKPLRTVYVLLPGERVYSVAGNSGETCDLLVDLAKIAVPRV